MTDKVKPLEPPDFTRCQAEVREKLGSFMTLGPRTTKVTRCDNPPHWLAVERQPGQEGQIGSMTLCDPCKDIMVEQLGTDYATLVALPPHVKVKAK